MYIRHSDLLNIHMCIGMYVYSFAQNLKFYYTYRYICVCARVYVCMYMYMCMHVLEIFNRTFINITIFFIISVEKK